MDIYMSSQVSTDESSLSERSPLTSSPLSTPAEPTDFESAPLLNVANGHGLGFHSTSSDPTFVLVIGGLGFIGSHTVLELLRAGFNGTYHHHDYHHHRLLSQYDRLHVSWHPAADIS